MKTVVKSFALVLLFAASICQAQSATDPDAKALDDVQQALYDGGKALERNDADALERYYASEWLSVSPAGVALASGKGFSATRNGKLVYDSIKISDPVTRVYGTTAVSTSVVSVRGHHNGKDISATHRVSTTLVKKGGGWKIVALVTSPLAVDQDK